MGIFNINVNKLPSVPTTGESVLSGSLVYLASDGKWYNTTATLKEKSTTELRIVTVDSSTNNEISFISYGEYSYPEGSLIAGAKYYVSAASGEITNTVYNNSTNVIRYVGTAKDTSTLLFNPDQTYISDYNSTVNDVVIKAGSEEDTLHTHLEADISDLDKYTQEEIDIKLGSVAYVDKPNNFSVEQEFTAGVNLNQTDITDVKAIHFSDANKSITWNNFDHTIDIHTGFGPVMQVGQELWVHVFNNSDETIGDGKAVYPIGTSSNGLPNIGLCIANTFETIQNQVGISTGIIEPYQDGFVTLVGVVHGINTSGLSLGPAYISTTTPGELTSIKPEFPDYSVLIGVVLISDAVEGSIIIDIRSDIHDTYNNFWNGLIRESFQIPVTSDGTTITATLSDVDNLERLTLMFSDGFSIFNTPASINLPAGTATSPILYYIYIPKTTKVLTYSTTGWPVTVEYIKIATAYIQDNASVQFHGPLNIRYWNDEIEDNVTKQGHLSHITERIRQENARYSSGIDFINTVTPTSNLISLTSGAVYQMHKTNISAFNMATGSHIHVANHFTTKFLVNTNLATLANNALGVSTSNSSFSFVVWGVVNSGTPSAKIMVNLPIGGYPKNAPATAVSDPDNYSVYTIPREFQGVAFLIARFTYTREANGDWSLYNSEDLRGRYISAGGSSVGGNGGVTTFAALTDTPSGYIGEANKSVRVAASEAGLEFYTPYYTHNQGVGSTTWVVNHGLNRYPSVTIIDSAGTQLYAAVKYTDINNLLITFNAVTSGIAELI